jgi:S1-C subfamily serine protease
MKRTLLEVSAGLAVLVLLASFHHQISHLRQHSEEMRGFRDVVQTTLAKAQTHREIDTVRRDILSRVETKIRDLEVRIAEASQSSEQAKELRSTLEAERAEYTRFKSEILSDVDRTKSLIDTYVDEMRSSTRSAVATIDQTRSDLARVKEELHLDHAALTRTMLAPTVQLNGDDTVGSGTLVWSDVSPKSKQVETYVLTSYHVVRNILADTPSARSDGVRVTVYLSPTEREEVRADMLVFEARIDAALLKLRTDKRFVTLAHSLRRDEIGDVRVWDSVYAVGCPLGNDPIPTHGEISSLRNELNGSNYWMINAPTYFGNSGGGVYHARTRRLVGVFSKIYTHGKGTPVVIPHMGLCTPIDLIHQWLEREKLEWALNGEATADVAAAPAK